MLHQRVMSHHFRFDGARQTTLFRSPHRYIWPAELDLMAQLAGFELEARHADWSGAEFTAESPSHVSVYRRPTGPCDRGAQRAGGVGGRVGQDLRDDVAHQVGVVEDDAQLGDDHLKLVQVQATRGQRLVQGGCGLDRGPGQAQHLRAQVCGFAREVNTTFPLLSRVRTSR